VKLAFFRRTKSSKKRQEDYIVKRLFQLSWLSGIVLMCLSLASGGPLWGGGDSHGVEKVLSAGEELRAPVDCQTFPNINIRLENLAETESVCWWTSFHENNERSENDIGPLFIRTITLLEKVKDTDTAKGMRIKSDRKTIQIRCIKTDEVLIHVVKGKILVKVIGK
jgi:hypothetical protein